MGVGVVELMGEEAGLFEAIAVDVVKGFDVEAVFFISWLGVEVGNVHSQELSLGQNALRQKP